MTEPLSDGAHALRCPRDPDHVFFEAVFILRVRQRVVVDWEGRPVDALLARDVDVLADAMDGRAPTCSKCGCEAMIGRPPEEREGTEIPW